VEGSDVVFCVSRAMIPAFAARASQPETKFHYVPCAVDVAAFSSGVSRRDVVRRELGFSDKLVFVYAGSLSAWQVPEKIIGAAGAALRLFQDAMFYAITSEPERLYAMALAAGLPAERVRCRRVPHAEVAAHLAAGDVGLLLREPNDVNRFSCPTKFAEYLACGLHVLATTSVDEVARTLNDTGAGTLVEGTGEGEAMDEALRRASETARGPGRRKSLEAAALYDWSRHLPTLKKWYLDPVFGTPQ